jgi:hypothetical protein
MHLTPKHITVASVSWHSASLLHDLFKRLLALAEHPDMIRFLVSDNLNGTDAELQQLDFPNLTIVPTDVHGATMSMAHAAGLDVLMPHIDTPYVLVIDPDIALFVAGWDTLCQTILDTTGSVAVGAPYPDWKLGKYHDFPSPPFAFWYTDSLKSLDPDWRPYGRTTGQRLLDFARRQAFWFPRAIDRYVLRLPRRKFKVGRWMERIVGVASKDTGWEIAHNARRQGWHAQTFDVVHDVDDLAAVPAPLHRPYRALAEEFELYAHEGIPILTHRNPTRNRLSFNLWTNTNIALFQDQTDKAAQTARWQALVAEITLTM